MGKLKGTKRLFGTVNNERKKKEEVGTLVQEDDRIG